MNDEKRFLEFARLGADWFWETDREDSFTYFSVIATNDGIDLASRIGCNRRDASLPNAENVAMLERIDVFILARRPFRNMLYRAGVDEETSRWCEISGDPRFDANGVFEGYRGVGRDVSALVEGQRALRAKSAALEAIMRATPDGVHLIDNNCATLAVNDQIYEILGIPESEGKFGSDRTYQSILRLAKRGEYGPGDPEQLARERIDGMLALIISQRHLTYERQLKTGRWIEARINALEDGGLLSLYRDITDLKQREAELERQAALLSTIVSNLDGIAVYDKDLRLMAWNEGFAELVGIDPSLLRRGVSARDLLISQAKRGEFGPCDPEAEADRRLVSFFRNDRPFVSERERPNGRVVELRRKPVPGGGSVTTYVDVTARMQAERALQELNATLENRIAERTAALGLARDSLIDAIDSLDHSMILWDREDRLVLFTRHLYDHYPDADKYFVVGRTFAEVVRAIVEGDSRALQVGEPNGVFPADRVAQHQAADGTISTRQLPNGRVLHVSDHRAQSGGTVSMGIDVTDRLRIEARLRETERMEAIGGLTGGLAHDLNNYLAVIMGNLDMLADRPHLDPESARLIEAALAGATRSAELTRSLLAFSRRQPLNPRIVDVGDAVGEVMRLLKRTTGEKITLTSEVASDLWPVHIDMDQLTVAIVNLANNSRESMPEGGVLKIAVRNAPAGAEDVRGEQVLIEVTDTGAGMELATLAQAFEPFFSTKGPDHGRGLGLSMVHGFVHQSGGTVTLASDVGKGTTVRILLPRSSESPARVTASTGASLPYGVENILLVEDNEHVRAALAGQLKSLGYRFTAVQTGDVALEILQARAGDFDLVFTDMIMPGLVDGLTLAKAVCDRWPAVRVVLTTGFAVETDTICDSNGKGFEMLRKPFRKADLARSIRAALAA